jgi:cbb3-type cytochrome oxidase subunit 3
MLGYVSAANKREAETAAVAQFDLDDDARPTGSR